VENRPHAKPRALDRSRTPSVRMGIPRVDRHHAPRRRRLSAVKVLFISSMYHKPGRFYAGDKIHRLAVELTRIGVEVQVICPIARFARPTPARGGPSAGHLPPASGRPLLIDGVPIWYVRFPNLPLGLLPGVHATVLGRYLTRAVEQLRPEFPFQLIHAHRLFPTGYAALQIAEASQLPIVVSAVGSDVHTHPLRNRGIRERTQATIRRSGAVLAVSGELAGQIQALETPDRPVRVIYRGVDVERFTPNSPPQELRARLGLPSAGLGLCTVANLIRPKGILELLVAFERLTQEFPTLWLSVVGDGPLRAHLESEILSMGLSDRVFLAGSRPNDEVADWMTAADVFVLASHNEGLPNVVLEAMACARPVVATHVGGIPEAVEEGVTGYLVRPHDPELLFQALQRALRSKSRSEMGVAGRDRVRAHFTWQRGAEDTRSVYAELLEPPPAS